MKFSKTISFEIDLDAKTLGEVWRLSKEQAEKAVDTVIEAIENSQRWSDAYKYIFEHLDGNEAMFGFGYLHYLRGIYDRGEENE